MWLPGRRAWKGGRQTPALTATHPASHLSGRSLTGAVRATAAITIAITGRSLLASAEGRPGHSRSSCSSREADALCQPPPRSVSPASDSPLSPPALPGPPPLPGSAPPQPPLEALRRRAADASTRRPRSGPALGGGPRMRKDERARAREAARCRLLLPQPEAVAPAAACSLCPSLQRSLSLPQRVV